MTNKFNLIFFIMFILQLSISFTLSENINTKNQSIKQQINKNNSLSINSTSLNFNFDFIKSLKTLRKTLNDDFKNTGMEIKTKFYKIIDNWKNFSFSDYKNNENSSSRTFGRIKRLQMMIIPIAFKLGVMFTMMKILVFLAVKSIAIGLTILVLNVISIVIKLVLLKVGHGHGGGHHDVGWSPPSAPLHKEVHLHVHNGNGGHGHSDYGHHHQSYQSNSWPSHTSYGPYARNDYTFSDDLSTPSGYNYNSPMADYIFKK